MMPGELCLDRLDGVEQRLARVEERLAGHHDIFQEMNRKLDKMTDAVARIESDSKAAEMVREQQLNGLASLVNRFDIWAERSTKLESRIEALESERKKEAEFRKAEDDRKDRVINRWQWAACFVVTIFLCLLTTIAWVAGHLRWRP